MVSRRSYEFLNDTGEFDDIWTQGGLLARLLTWRTVRQYVYGVEIVLHTTHFGRGNQCRYHRLSSSIKRHDMIGKIEGSASPLARFRPGRKKAIRESASRRAKATCPIVWVPPVRRPDRVGAGPVRTRTNHSI